MKALTKLLKARVAASDVMTNKRVYVHEERRTSAEVLSRSQYIKLLKAKAFEAAARPSSHPLITITPEMGMVIAGLLKEKK